MRPLLRIWAVTLAASLASALTPACLKQLDRCAGQALSPGSSVECSMPSWSDRSFELEVPSTWDGKRPLPLVVAFHGGGGNRESAARVTCPGGDEAHPSCLSAVALARGYAVLRPDGTGSRPLRNVRTWNAGGGHNGWNCTSGPACKSGVDDMRYVRELLDEVGKTIPIDGKRVFATGLSNGGAISHRLACELSDRISAIVALGGANQHAATGGACVGGTPVLQIHGTEDPCWGYSKSSATCLEGSDAGVKEGVAESMEGWRVRNGCEAAHDDEAMADRDPGDGTRATRARWRGCKAAVELITVTGGGHTWPSGYQYFSEGRIGRVTRDFGSEVIIDFFEAHARP